MSSTSSNTKDQPPPSPGRIDESIQQEVAQQFPGNEASKASEEEEEEERDGPVADNGHRGSSKSGAAHEHGSMSGHVSIYASRSRRGSLDRDDLTAAMNKVLTLDLQGPATQSSQSVFRNNVPESTSAAGITVSEGDRTRNGHFTGASDFPSDRHGLTRNPSTYFEQSNSMHGHEDLEGPMTDRKVPLNYYSHSRHQRPEDIHDIAHYLVRSHTRDETHETRSRDPSFVSGTETPAIDDPDYIPRPESYMDGVLGSLLKLYSSENAGSRPRGGRSRANTPSQNPRQTSPTSRPGTSDSKRLSHRNWSGHHPLPHQHTLAGLVGSSTVLATPGSPTRNITSVVSEKIKQHGVAPHTHKLRNRKKSHLRQEDERRQITLQIAETLSRHMYLVKLCRALMMYGAPTHRLEVYMAMSARALGIEGQFLYLPGIMIMSFDDSHTHTTEIRIIKVVQGLNLGRLHDVHGIYKEVSHDLLNVDEAATRLDDVVKQVDRFSTWSRVLLYGLSSALVAPFAFEGRYIDVPVAFALGCIVGVLQLILAPANELYANVFEITAAVLTSFLSRMLGSVRGGSLFCFSSLTQSSIALILPGYMVLSGSLELQNHQIVSGSVRMICKSLLLLL
jgi:uncharacterized membrane protein YjjP (DUF1212 family)